MREEERATKKRPEEKVSRRKYAGGNAARKFIMKPGEVIHFTSFRIEQRQQAAPGRAGATDSGLGGGGGAACPEKGPLAEGALF